MIFRKANQSNYGNLTPLQRIQSRIENHNVLCLSILDASDDDGVLVVLCAENTILKMVKISLQNHWPGEIEVYCPADLMIGSRINDDSAELPYQHMDKSLRYLN